MHKISKKKERRLIIKLIVSIFIVIAITILLVWSYNLYNSKNRVVPYSEVNTTDDYCYINVSSISDKFAYIEDQNIGMHFVIEKEDTGVWHTYIIAINEDEIDKFKDIINYNKGLTTEIPKPVKVYGYPVNIDDNLKKMSINNIKKFLPSTNEVVITEENYETYLTNSYLNTTVERNVENNIYLPFIIIIIILLIILFIMTLFDKNILVDKIDDKYKKIRRKKIKKEEE